MDSKLDLPTTTGASLPSAPRAEASTKSPSVRPPSIAPVTDDIDSEWLADDVAAPAGNEPKVPLPPKLPSVVPPAATALLPDAPITSGAPVPVAATSVAVPAVAVPAVAVPAVAPAAVAPPVEPPAEVTVLAESLSSLVPVEGARRASGAAPSVLADSIRAVAPSGRPEGPSASSRPPQNRRYAYLAAAVVVAAIGWQVSQRGESSSSAAKESAAIPVSHSDPAPQAAARPAPGDNRDLAANKEPEATKAPEPAKVLEATKAPEPIKAPEATKTPEPTKAPEATEATKSTKTPSAAPANAPEATKVAQEVQAPAPAVSVVPAVETATDQTTTIHINIHPDGSRVVLRGVEVGRTPLDYELPRGERRVFEIVNPGYAPRRLVIDGSRTEISFGLNPKSPEAP